MKNKKSPWMHYVSPIIGVGLLLLLGFYGRTSAKKEPVHQQHLKLGYFPNVTHAPAVVGVAQGAFQKEVSKNTTVDYLVFNAGPAAMEALLAGEVDMCYVGPGPALNTFIKTKGRALRILAGACDGGAGLVARPQANISSVRDLDGKSVAVPQLGGTQDISLRHFMALNNLSPVEKGGTVKILPIKNADMLALLKRGEIDAAWAPEPWITRLIEEAGAKLVVDERDLWPDKRFTTTVLVGRTAYITAHPQEVEAILNAHRSAVAFVQNEPEAAQQILNGELKRLTNKALSKETLKTAWGRVTFTTDANPVSIMQIADAAVQAGYSQTKDLDIALLIDGSFLEKAQKRQLTVLAK